MIKVIAGNQIVIMNALKKLLIDSPRPVTDLRAKLQDRIEETEKEIQRVDKEMAELLTEILDESKKDGK